MMHARVILLSAALVVASGCLPDKSDKADYEVARDAIVSAGKDVVSDVTDNDTGAQDTAPDTLADTVISKTCDLNTWKECGAGFACHVTPKSGAPKCVKHSGFTKNEICNPFKVEPQCGRDKGGAPMRCHPVYRKCLPVCGLGALCSKTTICDKKAPFKPYPVQTGFCLPSCGGACEAGSAIENTCYCDAQCLQAGDCCPDFKKLCPNVQSASPCNIFNWMGCKPGQTCLPKQIFSMEGATETSVCVSSGPGTNSCNPAELNSCAYSDTQGPRICVNGKCALTCRVENDDCPNNLKCEKVGGKTSPPSFGAWQ